MKVTVKSVGELVAEIDMDIRVKSFDKEDARKVLECAFAEIWDERSILVDVGFEDDA